MARDLNRCDFIGRLGKDVEIRYMTNGNAACSFSIACSDDYKDKNTGQKVDQTEWVNVSCFGKLAEICGQYLSKGSKVFVSGKLKTRKWQDQSGNDRYTTEVVLSDMQMLDSQNNQGGQPQQPQQGNQGYQQNQGQPQNAPQQSQQGNQGRPQQPQQRPQQGYQSPNNGNFDDEINF